MKRLFLVRHITVGFVLGMLIMPPQTARAQWTVYDPANHATQVERMIQDAARWLETINKYAKDFEHYAEMFDKAVEQLTTLKGMLTIADEQLAKHKDLIFLVHDVGKIIRKSFALHEQLESLVLHRIAALKKIDDRIRNGILDIDQDKLDFETYLRHTIGRSAQDTLSKRIRLAQTDNQLAFWLDEKQKLESQIAKYNELYKEAIDKFEAETNKPLDQQRNVQALSEAVNHYEDLIIELTRQHAELTEKITDRTAQYGVRIQDMENFARRVVSVNAAWDSLMVTHDNLKATLDDLILGQ
ncbi:MAG: hypothetical protein M3430_20720 [Acidobacteriota bacterium]|nr:hypothetical protein [Acidobacteriota bacterium]